ncbi:hypothetical protein ACIRP7_18360 [Streptomyces sp. NPDC102270]|uniref:hypothetical protein n=1 Tax=Streptomyces sp. NPDC102270 TaxID=3366150 RepID=UPI0037F55B2A
MPYDPTDPEAFTDPEAITDPDAFQEDDAVELGVEAPEGDAAEQHTDIAPDRDDPLTDVDPDRANEADLAEQARVVSLDEDDYR